MQLPSMTPGISLPKVCFVALNALPLLVRDDSIPVIGGAELQQVIVARGLVRRGYAVSMICRDFGQADEMEVDGIRVLRAFDHKAGLPGLKFIWPRLTSIWRSLRLANADIYYQRTAGVLTGIVAAYCGRHAKQSVFAAAGNPDLERPTTRIRYARDRWIYEYGLRNVNQIVVQNEEQARLCQLNYGRDALCIPNCYEVSGDLSDRAEDYILWVSTIRRLKQPELFLELARKMPDHQFVMAGGAARGEEDLFAQIQIEAASISNLEFMGFVPYARVEHLFDRAALFVNTSESEGFPNTFLQAWARSVPTLAFIDSGAKSRGRLVGNRVATFEDMKSAAQSLMADPQRRSEEGRHSQEYFRLNHSPESVLNLYEEMIKSLAETSTSRVGETHG